MAEQKERPRPHGDRLGEAAEENTSQRQSDAPDDAGIGRRAEDLVGTSDRARGRGSTANGIPEFDDDAGGQRRKQYDEGADLVSGVD